MTTALQPLTREGSEPNRAGRAAVSEAMARHLAAGQGFIDPDAELDAEALRAWAARLRSLARDLADCVEAPVRNRVMEMLASPSTPDDLPALYALRLNVAGASSAELGQQCDVSGRTVDRIEAGEGCRPAVAKKLADRFTLSVIELFGHSSGDSLRVRTVGELRELMLTPDNNRLTRL